MVQVKIRIEASSVVDPYLRYHGKAVNQSLDVGFWETQREKIVEVTHTPFFHEQTVDLPAGRNYVIYGNSAAVGYEWHARIYVNGTLIAEGDVNRETQLRAEFNVEEIPPPAPAIPVIPILIIAALAFLGGAIALRAIRT